MAKSTKMYERAYELHHSEGRVDEAREIYREIIQKYAGSSAARKAKEQLSEIEQGSGQPKAKKASAPSKPSDANRGASRSTAGIEPKFSALRSLSSMLKGLAVFNVLGGVLGGAAVSSEFGTLGTIFFLVVGVMSAFSCWALAELVRVLPAIEENTRKTAKLLEHYEE